ncbi:hypothetical protein LPJ73_000548 [Coemansia sp. RSA 2703]|nr:hypothetical protein LPJ73_000548 [Coemansia sp. RSA 2703]
MENEKELKNRRHKLVSSLSGEEVDFRELLIDLNLEEQYTEYTRRSVGICDGLRDRIPKLIGDELFIEGKKSAAKEWMLTNWFSEIFTHMMGVRHEYLDAQPDHGYVLKKLETKSMSGTAAKPDGAVYYSDYLNTKLDSIHMLIEAKIREHINGPNDDALGQMADYAQLVWQNQPTRTFVPVVFLHGVWVDLVIFARCGYRYARLGQYISNSEDSSNRSTKIALKTIHRLWFFMIQPPERFGHFVCVSQGWKYLRFEGSRSNTTVEYNTDISSDRVDIKKLFKRDVPISRRAAYVLGVNYRGGKAVLKLSWAPVERQPEGALYDILAREKIECLPEVYRSGIIVRDFLGYRLEYILMEDCGESLHTFFSRCGQMANRESFLYDCASNVIKNVCACLLQAAKVGVFHRDVSTGNITIREGKVFLIDWGFGKVVSSTLDERIKQEINSAWEIDLDKITHNEDARDNVTGTVLFMSIRVLMGLTSRSVFDDIESILYVVLVVLSHIGLSKSEANVSEMGKVSHRHQAYWKTGCMLDGDNYLSSFGVSKCSDSLRCLLDDLRRMLFVQEGKFIGKKLLSCKFDDRMANEGALKKILGNVLYVKCFPVSDLASSNAEGSNASRKRKSETEDVTDTDNINASKMPKTQGNQENLDPDDVFSP